MKTKLLSLLFILCTVSTPLWIARAGTLPIVDVRFSKTAFAPNAARETDYQDFRNKLVQRLSTELSKDLPGYRLAITFEKIPANKPAIHYVSENGERVAYQEPSVLSFSYQLFDPKNRIAGSGSTELSESFSYAQPTNLEPKQRRDFSPETELVLDWSKRLRQYRS